MRELKFKGEHMRKKNTTNLWEYHIFSLKTNILSTKHWIKWLRKNKKKLLFVGKKFLFQMKDRVPLITFYYSSDLEKDLIALKIKKNFTKQEQKLFTLEEKEQKL